MIKESDFIEILREREIIDFKNRYVIISKYTKIFPSLKVYVLGVFNKKIVINQISYNYKLKDKRYEFEIKDLSDVDVRKHHKEYLFTFTHDLRRYRFVILENKHQVKEIEKLF